MAETVDVSGRIAIQDAASPTIKKIEGSIQSLTRMASRMGAQFGKFANMGAFGGVATQARNAVGAMGKLGSSMQRMLLPIAALAGAAGFGGLAYEMQQYITTTDALAKTSTKFGIPIDQLQQLRYAAKLANVESSTLDKSLGILQRNMNKAAGSGGKDPLAQLFRVLNIEMKDATGNVRGAADVLPALANAMARNVDPALRMQMATAAFGKSGIEMITMLEQGGSSLRATMEASKRFGEITAEQAKIAEQAADAQTDFNAAITGVKNTIMAQLLPALLPVIKGMTDWVAANREWLATGIEKFIIDMATAIKTIDWERIWTGAKAVGENIAWVAKEMGGLNVIIPLVGAAIGASLLAPLAAVTLALGKLAIAIVSNPIGAVIAAIAVGGYLIYKNWDTIGPFFTKMWTNMKADFDAALAWVGDFLGQFVPGGMPEIWAGLVTDFTGIWNGVKTVFFGAMDWFESFILLFTPGGLEAAWAGVATYFSGVWSSVEAAFTQGTAWLDDLAGIFTAAWSAVSSVFSAAVSEITGFLRMLVPDILIDIWTTTLPQAMAAPWQAVSEVFSSYVASIGRIATALTPQVLIDAWSGLGALFSGIWDGVAAVFGGALTALSSFAASFIPTGITQAWAGVVGFFTGLWDGVVSAFQRAWSLIKPIIDAIMAAIGPVIAGAAKVAEIGGGASKIVSNVGSAAVSGAKSGLASVGNAASSVGNWLFGGSKPAAAAGAPGPLQQGAATAPQAARVEGEVETNIKITLDPGLLATATSSDTGQVSSTVNVGRSMVPA
jgi:hypothetical protein